MTEPIRTPTGSATILADPDATRLWLGGLGVRDADRGTATSAT